LLDLLSDLLLINEFFAYEFDVEPSPTGRTVSEEFQAADQVMF